MTLKSLKPFIATTALFFAFTIQVQAQGQREERPQRERPTFAKLLKDMDKNEDGKLSKEEIKGPLKEDFEKVDTNEDGFITEEEFKKAPKPNRRGRNNEPKG